jgi:hypothetical protein
LKLAKRRNFRYSDGKWSTTIRWLAKQMHNAAERKFAGSGLGSVFVALHRSFDRPFYTAISGGTVRLARWCSYVWYVR